MAVRKTTRICAKRIGGPVLILISLAFIPGTAAASTTHYVSSSLGNDSNSGTSKTSPWAHAPGMPTCMANCAAYTPAAGDQFIFYGGDTWTVANFQWNITWSGSSGSPIYFGVDTTWYKASVCGSSFCQPVFDFQNTMVSSSCDGVSCAGVIVNANYVTVDNIEFLHYEMANANLRTQYRSDIIHGNENMSQTGVTIENCYFKDWGMEGTVAPGTSADTGGGGVDGGFWGNDALILQGNIVDDQNGSCGSPATGCYTGGGVSAGYITKDNICRYTNGCFDSDVPGVLFQGNVVHDMELSTDQASGSDTGNHENQIYGKCWGYYIGNIVYNTPAGATLQLNPDSSCQINGQTYYTANNMLDMTNTYSQCWVDRGSTAHFIHYNDTCKTANSTTYFARAQTDSGTCPISVSIINSDTVIDNYSGSASPVTTSGTSSVTPFVNVDGGCGSPSQITITTSLAMSTSTANSQGYSLSDWWQPTLASNSTVGAGTNESSQCSGLLTGLCSALDPTDPLVSLVSRLASTSWDVGAYQFSGTSSVLQPPTGLVATVQ